MMKASNKAKILEKITEIISTYEDLDTNKDVFTICGECGSEVDFDNEMISYSVYAHEQILKSLEELCLYIENEEYKQVKASKQQISIF